MINTAPPASNSVYSREKLFWCDKIFFSNHVCHRGAVVKELLKREDKPGSTPGNAVFCFFIPFFFFFLLFGLFFFNTIFPFGLFFFILNADPAGHALGSIIYFEVRSFILKKVFQKLLICIPARKKKKKKKKKKKNKRSRHVHPLKQLIFLFFSVSWHYDKRHTVHHKMC